jgi:hypothetical protein
MAARTEMTGDSFIDLAGREKATLVLPFAAAATVTAGAIHFDFCLAARSQQ